MPNKSKSRKPKKLRSARTQRRRPGIESTMQPRPQAEDPSYKGSGKLAGRVALVTGGDSGLGRAVAICYANEGADIAIVYLDEDGDAEATKERVEAIGRRCVLIRGDVGNPRFCKQAVRSTMRKLGRLGILVNNAGEQHPQESLADITPQQLERTFRTNIFSMFYLTAAADRSGRRSFRRRSTPRRSPPLARTFPWRAPRSRQRSRRATYFSHPPTPRT